MHTVTVYSDYVCPFCFLALPALERLQREHDVALDWRAFELRPYPAPTLEPRGAYLINTWRDAVYPLAAQLEVPIRLPPVQPRSRHAFEGAELARQRGVFPQYHRAVFEAFFQRGLDIGEVEVLQRIAGEVGLDAGELRAALAEQRYLPAVLAQEQAALAQGINAVPTTIIGERRYAGLVPYQRLEHAVKQPASPAGGGLPLDR